MITTCECDACEGTGELDLESISIAPTDPRYPEWLGLQQDIVRCHELTARLSVLKPEHSSTYHRYLAEAVEAIHCLQKELLNPS